MEFIAHPQKEVNLGIRGIRVGWLWLIDLVSILIFFFLKSYVFVFSQNNNNNKSDHSNLSHDVVGWVIAPLSFLRNGHGYLFFSSFFFPLPAFKPHKSPSGSICTLTNNLARELSNSVRVWWILTRVFRILFLIIYFFWPTPMAEVQGCSHRTWKITFS